MFLHLPSVLVNNRDERLFIFARGFALDPSSKRCFVRRLKLVLYCGESRLVP